MYVPQIDVWRILSVLLCLPELGDISHMCKQSVPGHVFFGLVAIMYNTRAPDNTHSTHTCPHYHVYDCV